MILYIIFIVFHCWIPSFTLVYVIIMWYCRFEMQEIKWVTMLKTLHGVFLFPITFCWFFQWTYTNHQPHKEKDGNSHGMASSQDVFMYSLTRLERTKTQRNRIAIPLLFSLIHWNLLKSSFERMPLTFIIHFLTSFPLQLTHVVKNLLWPCFNLTFRDLRLSFCFCDWVVVFFPCFLL